MNQIPLLNGVAYSWAQIAILVASVPLIGCDSATYDKERKTTNNYGIGPEPVSIGYGNVNYTPATFDIHKEDWTRIINAAPNNDPTLMPPFQIKCMWVPDANNPQAQSVDTLLNCTFMNTGGNSKQGDTKHTKQIKVNFAGLTQL